MTDLTDTGDHWKAERKKSQAKRERNRASSPELLDQAGIKYESANGVHFKVEGPKGLIDFWPGTGLWKCRSTNVKRRGVQRLIKFIQRG